MRKFFFLSLSFFKLFIFCEFIYLKFFFPFLQKDNADLVGLFPLPESLKDPSLSPVELYPVFLNNNWLIALELLTEIWDATEETCTLLWDTSKKKV